MENNERIVLLYDCDSKLSKCNKQELDKALDARHIKELLDTGSFLGELGHPIIFNNDHTRYLYIDHTRIAYKLIEYWWEDNKLMGRIIIRGNEDDIKIVKQMIDSNNYKFMIRALGYKDDDGKFINMHLITFDLGIKNTYVE